MRGRVGAASGEEISLLSSARAGAVCPIIFLPPPHILLQTRGLLEITLQATGRAGTSTHVSRPRVTARLPVKPQGPGGKKSFHQVQTEKPTLQGEGGGRAFGHQRGVRSPPRP